MEMIYLISFRNPEAQATRLHGSWAHDYDTAVARARKYADQENLELLDVSPMPLPNDFGPVKPEIIELKLKPNTKRKKRFDRFRAAVKKEIIEWKEV